MWQGDSLPFSSNRLGDLTHAQFSLVDEEGNKQNRLHWEQGMIQGAFDSDKLYSLNIRLEYRGPFTLDVIEADFGSIHPYKYEMSVDFMDNFIAGTQAKIGVEVGSFSKWFPLENQHAVLAEGQQVVVSRDADHVGITICHQSAIPYGHRHFPKIRLGG